jgi:Heparinase II/III-like protein/Heparinase II/III N-terminus
MSLKWYAKRIASMSPREVLFRVGEQVKRSISRRKSYGWAAFSGGSLRPVTAFGDTLKANMTDELEGSLRASVASLGAGEFSAHGVAWPKREPTNKFPKELWSYDPVTGKTWAGSDIFCFDVKYRHRHDLGDIKYVWDFNRLQFLQPLAIALFLWQDEKAKAVIEGAIAGWYEANPPFKGLAWNSGIELSLRAVTLIFVFSLCRADLSVETNAQITTILKAHLYWLKRYPSKFSSANNHLIAELLGEISIAAVLSQDADFNHAKTQLERETLLQILNDGVGAEQSPTYGAFTAEMVLVADFIARSFGKPLAPKTGERLKAFATHISWLSDTHGIVPDIGDDDGGRVISLCHKRELAYPTSVARCIASQFNMPTPLPNSQDTPELRHALFYGSSQTTEMPVGIRTFPVGGYTVVRETRNKRDMQLVFDHGQLGYLSIAAHGHADALAFTLSLDNEAIFVDAGTYLYHSGGAWRDWFRGTKAHNTVTVEGVNQSLIAGPFNWSKKANSTLDSVQNGEKWVLAAHHDGYKHQFGVDHQRSISAMPNGIAIFDQLLPIPKSDVSIESTLQLAPGLSVEILDSHLNVKRADAVLVSISYSHIGEIKCISGGDETEGGWVSTLFGAKQEAMRIVWCGVMPDEGLRTELSWV